MNTIFAPASIIFYLFEMIFSSFMKKLLLAISVLFVLFIISVYVFIPDKIIISESRVVCTTAGGLDTCLHNLKKWKQWWPGKSLPSGEDSLYIYDGYSYALSDISTDGGAILIGSNSFSLSSRLQAITKNRDSVIIQWNAILQTGNNPFTRLTRYLSAPGLRKNTETVFESLCNFAGKTENIYGFPIERTTFTEANLVTYRFNTISYPSTDIIYDAISKLRQYIISQGAAEKYYPMMNTKQLDSSQYGTMIAISVDTIIQSSGNFFRSQMITMKDRFLATEVTGGPATIAQAHIAIEKYMRDHILSPPARPFEILLTDRSKETDTTKWRTKIFYPSM